MRPFTRRVRSVGDDPEAFAFEHSRPAWRLCPADWPVRFGATGVRSTGIQVKVTNLTHTPAFCY